MAAGGPTTSSKQTGVRLVVGVDGSAAAHNAFLTACQLLKKDGHMSVFHVFNKERDSTLNRQFKSQAVESVYSATLASKYSEARASMEMVESMRVEAPRRETLLKYVNGLRPPGDFLVVGVTGSKGPKADRTVLGSTTDLSLRGALMSAIVVKNKTGTKDGSKRFMVGVDGSHRALVTVKAVQELAGPEDSIAIVHVYNSTSQGDLSEAFKVSGVKHFYTDFIKQDSRCSFSTVDTTGKSFPSLAAALVAQPHEDEEATAFLAVGADGMSAFAAGKQSVNLGSFTEYVVKHSEVNVIVVQDRDEVHAGSGAESKVAASHK